MAETAIDDCIGSCDSEGWKKTALAARGEYILLEKAIKQATAVLSPLLDAYQGASDDYNRDYPLIRRCKKAIKALEEAKTALP